MEEDIVVKSGADIPVYPRFQNRTNTMIIGPTTTGKTFMLQKILQAGSKYFSGSGVSAEPENGFFDLVYVLATGKSAEDWREFECPFDMQIIDSESEIINALNTGDFVRGSIVIIDDMISRFNDKKYVKALVNHFCVTTHRADLWTFLLTQHFFAGDTPVWRNNTQNYIVFRNRKKPVSDLLNNLFPKENIEQARSMFDLATSANFRPLVIINRRPKGDFYFYAGLDGLIVDAEKEGQTLTVAPISI